MSVLQWGRREGVVNFRYTTCSPNKSLHAALRSDQSKTTMLQLEQKTQTSQDGFSSLFYAPLGSKARTLPHPGLFSAHLVKTTPCWHFLSAWHSLESPRKGDFNWEIASIRLNCRQIRGIDVGEPKSHGWCQPLTGGWYKHSLCDTVCLIVDYDH